MVINVNFSLLSPVVSLLFVVVAVVDVAVGVVVVIVVVADCVVAGGVSGGDEMLPCVNIEINLVMRNLKY